MTKPPRIYLSPPHLGTEEFRYVQDAFATNWIAPLGPHVDTFEREFAVAVGAPHAAALSSGTAALHLALCLVGVRRDDEVVCSTLTFSASANPISYVGAKPVFVDSERKSWNMDPEQLEVLLAERARRGRRPRAVILVHLYGQAADIATISAICRKYEVTLIEDAAEALGTTYFDASAGGAPLTPGTAGRIGIYSFNGNKIITTSGGGMLVSSDSDLVAKARFLATQARDPAPHYQHSEIGYNYRMSNVLAAIGRGQLKLLPARVEARRENFEHYRRGLAAVPGIEFMPEAPWNRCTRWLTCVLIDPLKFGADRETVRRAMEDENIEARPVWKPMHLQPVFAGCECQGGEVAEDLFARGLCLPSGSSLSSAERERVMAVFARSGRPR